MVKKIIPIKGSEEYLVCTCHLFLFMVPTLTLKIGTYFKREVGREQHWHNMCPVDRVLAEPL